MITLDQREDGLWYWTVVVDEATTVRSAKGVETPGRAQREARRVLQDLAAEE